MTLDEIVAECRRLRALAEAAETAYFIFLMKVETEYKDVWSGAGTGYTVFDQFLGSLHESPGRYANFVRGVKRTGAERALKIGVPLVTHIGRPETISTKVVNDLCAKAEATVEERGVAPKEQTVKDWMRQAKAPDDEPEIIKRRNELQRLRKENAELKALVAKLKAENAALKAKQHKKAA